MKIRFFTFVAIACITLTSPFETIPVHASEQKQETQHGDYSRVFINELLKWYIIPAIEEQYKAENRIHFAYNKHEMSVSNISIDSERHPFFLVSFKIKPSWQEGVMVYPNHWDRVTFQVFPAFLRQYGESKGIKLFKYEKNVQN